MQVPKKNIRIRGSLPKTGPPRSPGSGDWGDRGIGWFPTCSNWPFIDVSPPIF
ncbi:hypothetical protein OAG48_00525 [bacterium]|nr:hypothetical protein [bacterium]